MYRSSPWPSTSLSAWAEVLGRTVESATPGERGWHPCGRPDAAGFAAMGRAEALVRGTTSLTGGSAPVPPPEFAAAVPDRLFPR